MMKRLLATLAAVALLAGCTKSNTTSASTSQATDAAAGASAAAASPAATAAASGTAFVTIEIPIYPGSTSEPDKGITMSSGGSSVKIAYYGSKDDPGMVIAWYKAHLPSDWTNFSIANGSKSAATFSSPEAGNAGQSVVVTGEGEGTQIQLSTKTGS
jgi:ABC-type glycerol-3-phosphate transport system substrate-binding protein